MARRRRIALYTAGGVATFILLLLAALLVFTNTDWGRERVRQFSLRQIDRGTDGEIDFRRLEGNLLRRAVLVDVSIVDDEGRPLLHADTISTRFSVRGLLRRRIILTDVVLARPRVVLDKPPGETWNYVRIFRVDTDPPAVTEPRPPGFGDWVELRNVVMRDGDVRVRSAWQPPPDLNGEERERALRKALSGETRENVVRVPGGFQNVMEFRELNAHLTRVLPTHPDSAGIPIEIARFSGVVQPFQPPAAVVRNLAGKLRIENDSLHFTNIHAILPGSRLGAEGVYALHSGDLLLRMRGAPVAFADLRWLYPPLPEDGGGAMLLTVERRTLATRIIADDMDVRIGEATIEGRLDVTTGDTLRLGDTDLQFARVDTRLLEDFFDGLEIPRRGHLTGRLAATGPPSALRVDGDVAFDDAAGPTSRVLAVGELGIEPRLRFRDLRLRFQPLHSELARIAVPQLPVSGMITGFANLTGAPDGRLQLDSDLTLRDVRTGMSRVRATGGIDQTGELRLQNLLVRADPVRTDLLRPHVPELPAGATIVGTVRVDGYPARALQLDGDLAVNDPRTGTSRIGATGGIAFADGLRMNDLVVRMDPLRTELVRPWVPDLPAGSTVAGRVWLDGDLERRLRLDGDVRLDDPQTGVSRVAATGALAFDDLLRLDDMRLRFDPLRAELLREHVPQLPAGSTLEGHLRVDGVPARAVALDGELQLADPASGVSRFGATGAVAFNGEPTFDDMQLRLHEVQVDLLRAGLPELPPGGTLAGAVTLDGAPSLLHMAGDVTHRDPALGTSRVAMDGAVALTGELRFRDMDLTLQPLHMRLVRAFAPDLPIGGTLTGTATLDGAPADRIAVRGDLVHVEAGNRSHVVGSADIATGPGGWASVDVQLQPLALATAGAFVPEAGLHGSVSGRLQATGSLSDLQLSTDLQVAGGGAIRADGTLDLAAAQPRYDVDARMTQFNLAALSWRAPAVTRLTGTLSVAGRGTDPATMNAAIAADLVDSEVDAVGADRVRVHGRIDDGLATVQSSFVRLGAAEAEVDGSFGLVPWRRGDLAYRVAIDSLHGFAPWMPVSDTAVTPVTPPLGQPLAVAGDTALHQATDTVPAERRAPAEVVVADAVLGADSALIEAATAAPDVPRDSLSGRLHAAGTLRGNIHDFDVYGRADVQDLVFGGTRVGRGAAEYAVTGLRTQAPDVTIDGSFRSVVAAGLAFDTVDVEGRYRGTRFGEGRAVVMARQADGTEYSADAAFTLALDRSELRLADAVLRFDTVTWRTLQPGTIAWGDDAIEIRGLDLASTTGGRIAADGILPATGSGDLSIAIENVQVEQLVALAQQDADAAGVLDIEARITGTRVAPVMTGTALLSEARVEGTDAPDVRVAFSYAGRWLTADAQLVHENRLVAEARAELPMDLALVAVPQRLLPGDIAIDIAADSLPVEAFPIVTDHVEDVEGRVSGRFAVRGTFDDPVLSGNVNLALGAVRVVPLDVVFRDVAGTLTLDGSTVTVDSIVAHSGGPIRITGAIEVPTLTDPVFDIAVATTDAVVISTDDLRLRVDADVAVTGRLTALEVSGDAHARSGMIRIPTLNEMGTGTVVNLDDAAALARVDTVFRAERDALLGGPGPLENVRMDIALTIDRDVWVRSPEANVEIYTPPEVGPIRITSGDDDAFRLVGTINTDRGEYEFMGRRFNLTRGAVTFTGDPQMDALIQLAAEHEVRLPGREAFEIRVILSGTVEDLSITLESNSQPPISQTDLLSYLAFGRDASSLLIQQATSLAGQGSDAGELVGNVAALATQQLAAVAMQAGVKELEAGAMRDLGLDVFRITPADVPAELFTGRFADVLRGTQVEAGRYVSPRLFVAAQGQLGMSRPGIRAEYWSPGGFQWQAALQPRWLPSEPTLGEQEPRRASIFGAFLFREWRF